MKEQPPKPRYPLTDVMEHELTLALCSDRRVFAAVGTVIDSTRLGSKSAQHAVQAAQLVAKRMGFGPGTVEQVIQEVNALFDRGVRTLDDLDECRDYLHAPRTFSSDDVLGSVVPVIKRAMEFDAVKQVSVDYQNKVEASQIARRFEEIDKVGKTRERSVRNAEAAMADDRLFETRKSAGLFSLGIGEIDEQLDGIEKHSLTLFMGATGAGKSISLAHVAAEAMFNGYDTLYVTLELGQLMTERRIYRNLLHLTQREMEIDGGLEARRRFQALRGEGIGSLYVAYMDAHLTSPADIRQQVAELMRADRKWEPRVFAIDFIDKVRANAKASLYEDQGVVADGLRDIAKEHDGWSFTASQTKRAKGQNAWPDVDDIADSMNKTRSADIVIGIGRTDDDEAAKQVRFSIPKRREGEGAHQRVGPLDFAPEYSRPVYGYRKRNPW
ncbi:MAG TPA: DnaB-like helicase C-terminal domain-containing protein [Solirubrobacteraceae bacterium]|nr:DnaB-like helicase C-terminal domain-containing protein [Solirubrobacteraceae bacterium]